MIKLDKNNLEEIKSCRLNWFPGHMLKAMKKIQERLKVVDIVLEIRDARSPLATGNQAINKQMGEKSRLIVCNKVNLADPQIIKLWKEWFQQQGEPFIFTNCLDKKSLKQIIQMAKKIINQKRQRANAQNKINSKLKMMIIGLPNTGKSTIINKLANRNATKVADTPGQTRHQLWVTVNDELELLDTPGVMPPEITDDQHVMWLSALHAIPDKIIRPETSACYIVEHLLELKSKIFKERYKLESLDLTLLEALNCIAKTRGALRKKNEYDYDRVYQIVLNDFRGGELGPISFGLPPKD